MSKGLSHFMNFCFELSTSKIVSGKSVGRITDHIIAVSKCFKSNPTNYEVTPETRESQNLIIPVLESPN